MPTSRTPGCCPLHAQSLQHPDVRVAAAPHEYQQYQPAAATSGTPPRSRAPLPTCKRPRVPPPPRSRARRERLSRAPPVRGRDRRAPRPTSAPQRSPDPSRVAAPPRAPHGGPAPPSRSAAQRTAASLPPAARLGAGRTHGPKPPRLRSRRDPGKAAASLGPQPAKPRRGAARGQREGRLCDPALRPHSVTRPWDRRAPRRRSAPAHLPPGAASRGGR